MTKVEKKLGGKIHYDSKIGKYVIVGSPTLNKDGTKKDQKKVKEETSKERLNRLMKDMEDRKKRKAGVKGKLDDLRKGKGKIDYLKKV